MTRSPEIIIRDQERRIRELIATVEERDETIRQLRQEAHQRPPLPAGVPYLTNPEEIILRTLLAAEGALVSDYSIYRALYDHDHVDIHVIHVFICHLRKKLIGTGLKIINRRGRGFLVETPLNTFAAIDAQTEALPNT